MRWGLFGHFFSFLSFLFSFSLSLGDGPIQIEILSQRAVKPKTTNQQRPVYIVGCIKRLLSLGVLSEIFRCAAVVSSPFLTERTLSRKLVLPSFTAFLTGTFLHCRDFIQLSLGSIYSFWCVSSRGRKKRKIG